MASRRFLGIDVGGTAAKFVVLDDDGTRLHAGDVPTSPDDAGRTLARVRSALAPDEAPAAVGLACAGVVDPVAGRLGRSPNLPGWQGRDLRAELGAVFGGLPAVVANDVNAAIYGEHVDGAGRGCRHLVMLALGTGVGGGALVDGRLLTGPRGGAAEFGHMVLDPDGPVCTCGNRGCLEAWAGSVALLRAARAAATAGGPLAALVDRRGGDLTTRDLAALAEDGDPAARELFAAAGRALGQAVGNLVNAFDPDRVIVGGGVAAAGDLLLAPARAVYPGLVLCEEATRTPLVPALLGAAAAAVGAARLAGREGRAG